MSKVINQVKVAFSWEQKPGISKIKHDDLDCTFKPLTPPPCLSKTSGRVVMSYDEDDPFLVAYKKCTDQYMIKTEVGTPSPRRRLLSIRNKSIIGCTSYSSCTVATNNLVRVSHISTRPIIKGSQPSRFRGN
ncbi:hypothetical protein M5689_016826 [Euphorbia peplus]|nr:hypothetical protein M5689_016826 [Euphorbia peplus]